MKNRILRSVLFALLLSSVSCQQTDSSSEGKLEKEETGTETPQATASPDLRKQELSNRIYQGLGGYLVTAIELEDGAATIEFASSLEQANVKTENKELTPEDYWMTTKRIEKIFPLSTANLFSELDFLNQLNMKVPFQSKVHELSVSRKEYESFTGKSSQEIKENQQELFNAVFVNNPEGRKRFNQRFVNIR